VCRAACSGSSTRRPTALSFGRTTKAQERGGTREEDPRLHPSQQGQLVRRRQMPHQDLSRRRSGPGGDVLAAAGQRQHLRDQHGRVLGCGGHRGLRLPTPLVWIEHYPEHKGKIGEYSLVRFSSWTPEEVYLGGVWRHRIGSPARSPLRPEEAQAVLEGTPHIRRC
jgi:hypothetical protein